VRADAAFHAKALGETNLWGVDSHGVLRVPADPVHKGMALLDAMGKDLL
jgi:LDH2 family malate/lactate/ureidoglycolate dehydrogenase